MGDRSQDALVEQVMPLVVGAEAVAAVAAELSRSLEGVVIPEPIAGEVRRTALLAAPALAEASDEQKRATLGAIRSLFRQAAELLADPTRARGWAHEEPAVLNAQGRASGAFGPILAAVLERLGPPLDGRRRFLDIGTGAGWLAMALARAIPESEVTGIDIWGPALACARANVTAEGLEDRVLIVEQNVTELAPDARFDGAWLPGPFLPLRVVEAALPRLRTALRPGGLLFFGVYAGPPDPIADAVTRLRTARSGGHPFEIDELIALVTKAGFRSVHEVERAWNAPLRLVIGVNDQGSK